MIIGGVAASFLGRPRLTQDIDALATMAEADWEATLAAATAYGFVPRIENPIDFAHRTRVLLLRHSASDIDVDVTLSGLQFEQDAINRGALHEIDGVRFRLPQVEDLLIMKAIAHRPKDMEDIEGLLDAHPDANVGIVKQWVGEFAAATTMPDLLMDLEKLLNKHRK